MHSLLFLIVLAAPSYPVVTTQTESVSPAAWTLTSMHFNFDGGGAELKLQGCSSSPCLADKSNRMEGTETDINFSEALAYSTITGWLAENDSDVGDSELGIPGVQCAFDYSDLFPETNPDAPEVELKDLLDVCKLIN